MVIELRKKYFSKSKDKRFVMQIKRLSFRDCIYIFCFFVLWILLGFNTKMVDYEQYTVFYKYAQIGIRYSGIEIGFYLFMRVCAILGLSYYGFLKLYAFSGICLVYKSVKKFSDKSIICILLLLFCPFIHIIAAVRNFMAWALLIWAIQYIYNDSKSPTNIIKYIFCILLAATFHTVALFYLLFLLCKFPLKKIKAIVLTAVIVGIMMSIFNQQIFGVLNSVIPKLNKYLALGLKGTRLSTKFFLLMYFITKYIICILFEKYTSDIDKVLLKINILSILSLPICFFNMNFMRIEYNVMLIMSIYIFNIAQRRINKFTQNIKCLYITYYLISGFFLMYLFSAETVKLIWTNNSFFSIFIGG